MRRGTKKQELYRLKKEAHRILEWHFPNRAIMYSWIQANFSKGHIAQMNEDELKKVIKAGRRLANKKGQRHV